MIKQFIITVFLYAAALHTNAQQALKLIPQAGATISLLNKNIFANKALLVNPMAGLQINKPVSKNFGVGIEAQYTNYNLGSTIQQQYNRFITGNSVKNFSATTALNGLLNLSYTVPKAGGKGGKGGTTVITIGERAATNKGGKGGKGGAGGETVIYLGAGVQRLTTGGNSLQVPNPFAGNQLTTIYRENEGTSTNPIIQLGVTKSLYIKPCMAIDISIKAQYIRYNNKTIYKSVPTDTGQSALDKFFINNPDKVDVTHKPFTVIPTIGLRFILGGCRNPKLKEPKQELQQPIMASCFAIQQTNAVPKDTCFRGDTLQFIFKQKNLVPGGLVYEVFIAPVNELKKEQLIHTLSYPSAGFNINSVLLDANRDYVVIVKLRNADKTKECLQYFRPVKRCADCCKDVKLPK
jgi:hypothetical protein